MQIKIIPMSAECLFNKANGVKDEDLAGTIGITKPGECDKKCKRCGNRIYFRFWQGIGRIIGYVVTASRPDGCNGETHP